MLSVSFFQPDFRDLAWMVESIMVLLANPFDFHDILAGKQCCAIIINWVIAASAQWGQKILAS